MKTFSFKYRIDGIPCIIKVYDIPEVLQEIRNGDITRSEPMECEDVTFDVLDKRMRLAKWLAAKVNSDIRADVSWKARRFMIGDYNGEDW